MLLKQHIKKNSIKPNKWLIYSCVHEYYTKAEIMSINPFSLKKQIILQEVIAKNGLIFSTVP